MSKVTSRMVAFMAASILLPMSGLEAGAAQESPVCVQEIEAHSDMLVPAGSGMRPCARGAVEQLQDSQAAPNAPTLIAQRYRYRNTPPWGNPNECFTDEGYGRYSSCS